MVDGGVCGVRRAWAAEGLASTGPTWGARRESRGPARSHRAQRSLHERFEGIGRALALDGIDELSRLRHFETEGSERVERLPCELDGGWVERLSVGCSVGVPEDEAGVGIA